MAECKDIRKRILELAFKAGSNGSHLGGSLSAVEIINTLYHSGFNFNPADEACDRLILSKGHAALALYCVLESIGIITKEDAETFEQDIRDKEPAVVYICNPKFSEIEKLIT